MTTTDGRKTLVLAGTGKTGRRVVERLTARGLPPRVGSRGGNPRFDWHDQATWEPALQGVGGGVRGPPPRRRVPGRCEDGRCLRRTRRALRRHAAGAVGRSWRQRSRALPRGLRESGAEWTVVRTGFISQNFSEDVLADEVRAGVVTLPAGQVAEPFTDAEDIADVATAALTEDGHVAETYEVTGPRLLTFADAVAE